MNLPTFSGKKLVNFLVKKFDFKIIRQKGSHVILKHDDGRVVTVPCHNNEDLSKGLFIKIIKKEVKVSVEEFVKMLTIFMSLLNN